MSSVDWEYKDDLGLWNLEHSLAFKSQNGDAATHVSGVSSVLQTCLIVQSTEGLLVSIDSQ